MSFPLLFYRYTITNVPSSIIAACIPCLKRMMENVLRNMGFLPTTRGGNSYYMNQKSGSSKSRTQNNTNRAATANDDGTENDDTPVLKTVMYGSQVEREAWETVDSKA